ncbi:hypothetical protein [Roseibium sp.]|uniref:hypothetical protein n=1 Tax=Roseibium sp. TaxID=1936156 RepID=UPI003D0ACC3A
MAESSYKLTRKYYNPAGHVTSAGESSNINMFDFGIVLMGDKSALGYCPICFGHMPWEGATEDHIVTGDQFLGDYNEYMTNEEYNAGTNIMSAHHRCNSFKSETDLFAYWRAHPERLHLTQNQYRALIAILDHLAERGMASMTNIAPSKWHETVFKIVRSVQNRDPDFVHLSVKK